MESKTFYEKELDPLRVRALIVSERHKHAIKKYRHDRGTHDGSMVVDRPLFLKLLTSLASAAGLLRVNEWDLAMLYSETRHATEQDNAKPVRVDNEEPKMRVPSRCVVDLIGAYHDRFVVGRPRVIKATPKKAKTPPYKRTTTKADDFDQPPHQRGGWNGLSMFRGQRIGTMSADLARATLKQLKNEAQKAWDAWDNDGDWGYADTETSWENYLHPAYEAILLRAHNLGLHSTVRKYKPVDPNHDNLTVETS